MSDPSEFREPNLRDRDFLGAFALLTRGDAFLFVQNRRRIGGRETLTWDLPGGQVEPGELLPAALAREVREETGLVLAGPPEFAFLQEGERVVAGRRRHAWRSFFFHVREFKGEPAAGAEVLATAWLPRADLGRLLTAPYQQSFLAWLAQPVPYLFCRWAE